MTAKIRHTKSTSGRTHVLTVTTRYGRNLAFSRTHTVVKKYKTAPQFDDQVQGDLIRQYWAEGGQVSPIGRVPGGVTIDPVLDEREKEAANPTPRQVAEACWEVLGKPETVTADQFIGAIMTAVRKDRELYR